MPLVCSQESCYLDQAKSVWFIGYGYVKQMNDALMDSVLKSFIHFTSVVLMFFVLFTTHVSDLLFRHACMPGVTDQFCQACKQQGVSFHISDQRARRLLGSDMREFEHCVRRKIRTPLTANEFSALVSFAFNVGCANFASSQLRERLNDGDYKGVPNQLLRWSHSNGQVDAVLQSRRLSEIGLFDKDHCGEGKQGLRPKKAAKAKKPKLTKQTIP